MKRILILSLLLLSACAPYMVHRPDVALTSANEDKYSDDLDSCRHEVFSKRGIDVGQSAAIGGFGLLGMAAYGHPPAYDDVDNCLRAKNYKIAN